MKLKDLDIELSNKIGDPVVNNDDGAIFTKKQRIILIKNAYVRLIRTLSSLMRSYAPTFAKSKHILRVKLEREQQGGKGIELYDKKGNRIIVDKISELFVRVVNSTQMIPVSRIDAYQYLTVKYGDNDIYSPSIEEKRIYYAVLDNKIYLLPESNNDLYDEIEIVYKSSMPMFEELEDEVEIDAEFKDLLLEIAANEAMMDIGRSDKYQLYTSDINNQYQVLAQYADLLEKKEGSNINDR